MAPNNGTEKTRKATGDSDTSASTGLPSTTASDGEASREIDKDQVDDPVVVPGEPENSGKPKDQAWVTPDPNQAEAQEAGEATQEDPAAVNEGSTGTDDSKLASAAKGACKCCSLKSTKLLGDSMPEEEMKFGNRTADAYMTIVRTQVCEAPLRVLQQVVLAIPFVIGMTLFSVCPNNGNIGASGLTVAISGALAMVMNMTAACCPVLWSAPSRMYQIIGWSWLSMSPVMVGNVWLKWNMFNAKVKDGSQTQIWNMPAAIVMAISVGKVNTVPGWYPKWNTCWCVCSGLSRAIGTCCLYYLAGFVAVTVLHNFIYYDNTVFSLNESLTMAIVRPIIFTCIKKLVWAFFAIMSWLRHPFLAKAVTMAASAILGFATAVAFTKTRTWTALVLFVLTNIASHSSRMWVFTGARFSTSCFLLEWFKRFMTSGKPIASSEKMKLRELRGFENMAQSWGTTFGMAMFIVFYPIVKFGFGDDTMPARFFFPTELSIVFLCIAYVSELALDVHTQVTTIHGTKCDYEGLFSLKARSPMSCGVLFLLAYVSSVMNAAWDRDRIYQVGQGNEAQFR